MRTTWCFHSAGKIVFGRDAVLQLGDIASRLNARRALIVTDLNLVEAGLPNRARGPLEASGLVVATFTGGEAEPSMHVVESCVEMAEQFQPDLFVGLGGGSNMDLAKITATIFAHGGHPRDYVGDDKVPGSVLPVVCVPTTAGTGSEVSAASVLTDPEQEIKVGILSNYLRPSAALVDPLLTASCPAKVTADSGIDALTHAIEAYVAVDNETFPLPEGERTVYQGRHPLGLLLAEKAISLIGQFLRRAVNDGSDTEAREGMSLAALLAGLAFSNIGVAVVHALEYPVGVATHCSHGEGNGLLLPYVMRFNLPGRETEMAAIARLLGEDIDGLDEMSAADRGIQAVEKLKTDIGIPLRLRDLGVQLSQLRPFAEKSFGVKRILRVNPRPVTLDDLEAILQSAF